MTAEPGVDSDADTRTDTDALWADALTAAALLAVDPVGLGGALVRAHAGPQRALWLAALQHSLPAGVPMRRVPHGIADERLLGGLDLTATLQAGRPVAQRGVLAEADGGLVLLAMAERLSPGTAARVAAVLDSGQVLVERDGLALRQPARIGVVALDEGLDDGAGGGESAPQALADRLAFHLLLEGLPAHGPGPRSGAASGVAAAAGEPAALDALLAVSAADVAAARAQLPRVASGESTITALCRAAAALGVDSLRAPWLALRAACAAAALQGHDTVQPDDAALAARLVLGPRATRWPAPAEAEPPPEQPAQPAPAPSEPPADAAPPPAADATTAEPPADDDPPPPPDPGQPLDEVVLEAALAAMPAGLLAQLKAGARQRSAAPSAGRVGALQAGGPRGRPLGARRGELRGGARLDLIATLRAAAPWQPLRQREAALADAGAPRRRVLVRAEDFHISRRAQRRETTTLFVVDASGSAALHRLAEAKGAVELLLADCYVRRDRVALLAFRGAGAELVLPPTRSLVRAKRALAGLPGGGGTPLALALDSAAELATSLLRRGGTPVLVLLSDARANIARNGQPGRGLASSDALASARRLRALGLGMLMVDTAPGSGRTGVGAGATAAEPTPARLLADALGALYLPLPQMDAAKLSRAARALSAPT
ncbi:MAG: magnesium chelatase subunit D [Pseudomonadota bacterium]